MDFRVQLVGVTAALAAAACFVPVDETREPTAAPKSFMPVPDAGSQQQVDSGAEAELSESEDAGRRRDAGCRMSVLLNTRLPYALHEAAAFFDGQKIWLLGGSSQGDVTRNTIFSFDPVTEVMVTSNATLPVPEQAAYFASKGTVIYLLGGGSNSGLLKSIVKFDSSTQTVTTMNAQLPTARYKGAAAWYGQYIYLFGGWNGGSVVSDIIRYDTVNDTVTQIPSDPSLLREQAAAFVFGSFIYIASGHRAQSLTTYPNVVRFDPATSGITATAMNNPIPRFFTGDSSDGRFGYIFGGIRIDNHDEDEIMRLDVATNRFEQVGCLVHAKHGNAWTYANGSFYSLGGMNVPARTWLTTIQKWTPP